MLCGNTLKNALFYGILLMLDGHDSKCYIAANQYSLADRKGNEMDIIVNNLVAFFFVGLVVGGSGLLFVRAVLGNRSDTKDIRHWG